MRTGFLSNVPTLAQVAATRRAAPKHAVPTIKQEKGRAGRAEGKVKRSVREQCVDRDGPCRYAKDMPQGLPGHVCQGPSEWAHLHDKRRSKTRGQAPEVRHTTADSLMLCRLAHDRYDGRRRPRLGIAKTTKAGADGPLRWMDPA